MKKRIYLAILLVLLSVVILTCSPAAAQEGPPLPTMSSTHWAATPTPPAIAPTPQLIPTITLQPWPPPRKSVYLPMVWRGQWAE